MRILVCGSRSGVDRVHMSHVLGQLRNVTEVIHGGGRGVDTMAGEWAARMRIPVKGQCPDRAWDARYAAHCRRRREPPRPRGGAFRLAQ